MNHSLFEIKALNFGLDTSHEVNERKREFEQTKHKYLRYGVVGGDIGAAIIMMWLFGTIYCLREYHRQSRRQRNKRKWRESVKARVSTKDGT